MATDDSRQAKIEKLESKVETAKKKLALERQKQNKSDQKIQTRKKILIGAFYLEQFEKNPDMERQVMTKLETWLKRDHDREVFGLAPLPKQGQT